CSGARSVASGRGGSSPSAHIVSCRTSLLSLMPAPPRGRYLGMPGGALQDQRVLVLDHPFDHFPLRDFQGLRQGRRTNQIPLAVLTAALNHLHRGLVTQWPSPV